MNLETVNNQRYDFPCLASPCRLTLASPVCGMLQVGRYESSLCPNLKPNWTVVRTHGLRLMRQEKSWRPIVRLEVDKHYVYETVLGCDGQNVNMKETFSLCVIISP